MIIPGFLIAIATFPGVIVHEAAHLFFCKLRNVAVFDVCFFRLGNPSGYVAHEQVEDFTTSFLVSVGPFIVNSVLCVVFCFPAFLPVRVFGITSPVSYFWLWLGVSIGMHAFPSTQDATVLWRAARRAASSGSALAIVSFPLVIAIYVANALRFFWIDALYGLTIGLGLPEVILTRIT